MKNNKVSIYFSSELFYEFISGFEKYRFITGLKKNIENNITVCLSGFLQNERLIDYKFIALRMKLVYSI